jgi:hypothetical protein
MPFTVSHAAAVLPAYRPLTRARVFSAALIGSMVPDFGMLLPGSFARWQTHSFPALFLFCVPVGLLAYALTQALIKPALMEVLPDRIYLRLRTEHPPMPLHRLSTWVYAALAVLAGALTHLVWDGFTHENARAVRYLPILSDYGPEMGGHALRLYRWLQYGSSLLGLLVVVGAVLLWLRHAAQPAAPPVRRLGRAQRRQLGVLYLALPAAACVLAASVLLPLRHGVVAPGAALGAAAVLLIQAAALSLLLVSGLIRLRLGR